MSERLQKFMAHAGVGSRRACEAMIEQGRVQVNGQAAKLGMSVVPGRDQVQVDGQLLASAEPHVYVALNKPPGYLSSRRSQGGQPTVVDLVSLPQRVYPVGRLDADSQGLILLTNDGDLANRLTHPRFEHEKEYLVLLDRSPSDSELTGLRQALANPGHPSRSAPRVRMQEIDGEPWLRVILREGRNRQIRKAAEELGFKVRTLVRVRIHHLTLGNLKEGHWRHLAPEEVEGLRASSHVAVRSQEPE
jgi:23S rRNA pseudouridine2605 synthase